MLVECLPGRERGCARFVTGFWLGLSKLVWRWRLGGAKVIMICENAITTKEQFNGHYARRSSGL